MYLLLLAFGGLLGAAGVVLAGSGMSLRDGTFDAGILTPAMIAVAGGFLLIGLGAGLRTLQRIERTLAARPMPGALAIAESAKAAEGVETARERPRIPFAPKASQESQPGVASRDILADKRPAAPGADKPSQPISALAITAVPDENVETFGQPSGKKNGNGAGGVRTVLGLSGSLRRPSAGERQGEPALDAVWPKVSRSSRAVDGDSGLIAKSTGVAPISAPHNADASNAMAFASNPDSTAAGTSVLKSGVVNGMPYTLYSDGSIEAQLPEGTLRFGSITELRNHIEQSA
jgi:hypothetical protein